MTTRHNQRSQGTPVDLLVPRLPDRFLDLSLEVQGGIPVGLRQYILGMTEWIDSKLGTTERDRRNGETTGQQITPELMRELGCEPAEWYKRILSGFDQPDAVNKPDAEHGQTIQDVDDELPPQSYEYVPTPLKHRPTKFYPGYTPLTPDRLREITKW